MSPSTLVCPVHVTDLENFWSELRAGNYVSAAKMGIRILDCFLNPNMTMGPQSAGTLRQGANRGPTGFPVSADDGDKLASVLDKIEDEIIRLDPAHGELLTGKEVTATRMERTPINLGDTQAGFSVVDVITIAKMVMDLFAAWRKRREPTNATGAVLPPAPAGTAAERKAAADKLAADKKAEEDRKKSEEKK